MSKLFGSQSWSVVRGCELELVVSLLFSQAWIIREHLEVQLLLLFEGVSHRSLLVTSGFLRCTVVADGIHTTVSSFASL